MLAELELASNRADETMISLAKKSSSRQGGRLIADEDRLTIRVARTNEAAGILELVKLAFCARESRSLATVRGLTDIERLMKRGTFLVATNKNQIVGCAYIEPRPEATRLELLAVSPSQQRAGIGSQLMETAERLSGSMHCLFMHLRIMNLHWEALRFCRRRGYVEFGIESVSGDQPVSQHCHFVRMFKPLKPDCIAF